MLNREPMGMKPYSLYCLRRAGHVSVLNREPMGMKLGILGTWAPGDTCFSAQPRADGDEAAPKRAVKNLGGSFSAQPRADGDEACPGLVLASQDALVSVLNREPMGMKPLSHYSAYVRVYLFQYSTASRWG